VVLADFQLSPPKGERSQRTVWRYQRADWQRLRSFFRRTDWSDLLTDDVNESCSALTNTIKEGMKRFIPSKTLTTRATDPPWWTPECSSAIQQKDKAWKRHTRHRHSAEQLNAYKCATAATDRVGKPKLHTQHRFAGRCFKEA